MKIAFAALLILVVSPWSSPVQASILDIQEVTSTTGIKAWLVEDHSVPVISVRFMFKGAGAVNDPADKQGLSQVLSNTLDEGAGDLDSKNFQAALNDKSISLGFQSGRDNFGGSIKTLTKYKVEAFDLLTLALTKPRFDKDPVARMIDSNLVRIRSSMTDPEWMNARLTNAVIYGEHPYAINTGGTLSSLPRITPNDLRAKFKSQMAQDNVMVAVAGDMTPADVSAMLDKVFGQIPKTSITKKVDDVTLGDQPSVSLYKQDIPQTIINMVMPGIDQKDPDFHAAEVMDFVLGSSGFGSRLTEEVREKRGLTYGIYSGLGNMAHSNTLSIGTATRNEMTDEVIKISKEVISGMVTSNITENELKDAKSYLIGSVPLQLTSTDRISAILIGMLDDGLSPDYMEQRSAAIQRLTTKDVYRVSQRLLSAKNIKIMLVGNPKIGDNYQVIKLLPNVE